MCQYAQYCSWGAICSVAFRTHFARAESVIRLCIAKICKDIREAFCDVMTRSFRPEAFLFTRSLSLGAFLVSGRHSVHAGRPHFAVAVAAHDSALRHAAVPSLAGGGWRRAADGGRARFIPLARAP